VSNSREVVEQTCVGHVNSRNSDQTEKADIRFLAGQSSPGSRREPTDSPVHPRNLYCEEIFLPVTWINMDAARVYEEMVQVRGGNLLFSEFLFLRRLRLTGKNVKGQQTIKLNMCS
jgi:hypothetical protein